MILPWESACFLGGEIYGFKACGLSDLWFLYTFFKGYWKGMWKGLLEITLGGLQTYIQILNTSCIFLCILLKQQLLVHVWFTSHPSQASKNLTCQPDGGRKLCSFNAGEVCAVWHWACEHPEAPASPWAALFLEMHNYIWRLYSHDWSASTDKRTLTWLW